MKLYTKLLLLAAPMLSLQAQAQDVYLNSDFEGESPRAGYTWVCEDDMGVKSQYVKKIFDRSSGSTEEDAPTTSAVADWFLADGVNGNNTRVMMSYSQRTYEDVPTDNWLFTPQLDIKSSNAWLAWDAQSVHFHARESYEVYVGTDKDDFESFEKVFSTDEEDYFWTHHLVSLQKFAGKKVYVAFVHTSTNKYLLAIDNVFVGELPADKFSNTDRTLRTTSVSAPTGIDGTLWNTGADISGYTLRCTTITPQKDNPDLTETKTLPVASLASNATLDYHFDTPVTLNKTTKYSIDLLNAAGNVVKTLVSDSIFASNYPRTLLMEKATSYWCTACPGSNPFAYDIEHRYGNQVAEVVVQYPANNGTDTGQMVCEDYYANVRANNLPTIYFNRSYKSENGTANYDRVNTALTRPCYALPQVVSATCNGQTVKAKLTCQFGGNMKNSNNTYAVGVALIENIVDIPLPQENIMSTRNANEYFYLPAKISSPLNYYVNVVREGSTAFTGITDGLPTQIEKDKVYEINYEKPLPAKVRSLMNPLHPEESNLTLVAILLNTATKEVINASKLPVQITGQMGIDQAAAAAKPELVKWDGAYLAVFPAGETGTVSVYATDGRLISRSNSRVSLNGCPAGTYIVKMQAQSGASVTTKIVK